MRFKAALRLEKVPELVSISNVLAKYHRQVILHLTPPADDRIEFIVSSTGHRDGLVGRDRERDGDLLAVWASLEKVAWFSSYQLESKAQDHIALQLEPTSLSGALRSALRGQLVQLRLRRKLGAVLSLEIALHDSTVPEWDIIQDVAVEVLPPARLQELREPPVTAGARGVVLSCPERLHAAAKRLRALHRYSITEMEPLCAHLSIEVKRETSSTARLRLSVPTTTIRVGLTFTELKLAYVEGECPDAPPGSAAAPGHADDNNSSAAAVHHLISAKIPVGALANALEARLVHPQQTFCFVLTDFVLLHFAGEEFEFSCYVPRCDEDETLDRL
jgi:hypothetical protein